jgi:hypothetical protein
MLNQTSKQAQKTSCGKCTLNCGEKKGRASPK